MKTVIFLHPVFDHSNFYAIAQVECVVSLEKNACEVVKAKLTRRKASAWLLHSKSLTDASGKTWELSDIITETANGLRMAHEAFAGFACDVVPMFDRIQLSEFNAKVLEIPQIANERPTLFSENLQKIACL